MSKEKIISIVAKRAGISPEELTKALESGSDEGLKLDIDGEFISNTDLEAITAKAQKTGHGQGFDAGQDVLIKEIKNEQKLEFVEKTKENLLTALKSKYQKEFGTEPNKRIDDLETDNKKLKELVTETENKLKAESESYNSKLNGIEIEQKVKSMFPEKLANGLSREDAYTLYMAKNKIEKQEAGIVLVDPVTKQMIKDNKLNPVSINDHVKTFVESFGKVNDPGRGKGDDPGKGRTNIESFTKRSEVDKYITENEIPLSEQSGILAKAMKNEGFKINE